ncbi:MAG TPA: hypothetical protein VLC98_05210 [Phnomibacter sp.]|nr:hypothetical protein [Phnomibacter sp.]
MSRSYKIQSPITDLASLRAEKLKLREHIKASDLRLKQTVKEWPLTSVFNIAHMVGNAVLPKHIGTLAAGVLGYKASKKNFLFPLLKATAVFAGTQLIKHFTKGKSDIEIEDNETGEG